ncbi:hypothetical protein KC967_04520 [Candidatus Saccharibacteria bacterium]|nr:hypothetical protein [Candidatus Saccharibacteria bacterium]
MSIETPNANSVEIIEWKNREVEEQFVDAITSSFVSLREILPLLPEPIQIYFDERRFAKDVGATGYANTHDQMAVCINKDFTDRELQRREIKPLVFHEGYHMADKFTYADGKFSGIESAIAEGKAVVFEMRYADSTPHYANWQDEQEKIQGWYEALRNITADQYFEESGETWQKWAFWDDETQEASRVYKVGTWMIEQVLAARGLDIVELCGVPAQQILEWFEAANNAV